MKITAIPQEKGTSFQPVDITFTLESQGELNALGSLFNTCHVICGLHKTDGNDWGMALSPWLDVHKVLEILGADTGKWPFLTCKQPLSDHKE